MTFMTYVRPLSLIQIAGSSHEPPNSRLDIGVSVTMQWNSSRILGEAGGEEGSFLSEVEFRVLSD